MRGRAWCLTINIALLFCACVAMVGCQSPWSWPTIEVALESKPEDMEKDAAKPRAAGGDSFAALADENWILAVAQDDDDQPSPRRWRHLVLEELLARPRDKQPDWHAALASDRKMVSINAAIALARLNDGDPAPRLIAAVRDTELKLNVRRATAEALAEPACHDALEEFLALCKEYGQFTGEARRRYTPELHAELIQTAARMGAAGGPMLLEALKTPAPEVKRAALEAYLTVRGRDEIAGNFYEQTNSAAIDLTTDADPQVRIAALKLLIHRNHEQTSDKVTRALADYELPVRLAAIEMLGRLEDESSLTRLHKLTTDSGEMIRAAATKALAARGDWDALATAANDKSWRVRREVATALSAYRDRRATALAQELLSDNSAEVQRAVIRAISQWRRQQAGPILLAAMESTAYQTRKDAATALADAWPAAAGFPLDAPAARRAEIIAGLQEKWSAAFGNIDLENVANRVADSENTLADATAEAAVQNLLKQLEDKSAQMRQTALVDLVKQAKQSSLPPLALDKMVRAVIAEQDPALWFSAFDAIAADPREEAAQLAAAGLGHPSAEVRRRACEYFARFPDFTRTEAFAKALADPSAAVVHAGVHALAALPILTDPKPLEQLLAAPDHLLRVEAAAALAKHEFESGRAALERLAADADVQVRRETAAAIGRLHDEQLLPLAIRLLDDQQEIRRAALASLESITGQPTPPTKAAPASDIENASPTIAERAQAWRQWYAEQR